MPSFTHLYLLFMASSVALWGTLSCIYPTKMANLDLDLSVFSTELVKELEQKMTSNSTKIARSMLKLWARYNHTRTVIGIDLGTTNSAVAAVINGKPQILENDEGARTTPSVVAYTKDQGVLVGAPAKRQAVVNLRNTFFATKRLIGRKFGDEEVKRDIANVPYTIIPHTNGDAWLETTDGTQLPPAQVLAHILQKLRTVAVAQLADKDIKHAVVTVPAYFNDAQRLATKGAGKIVGLDVMRVLNEPTAAALAYGINRKNGIVAVFDLGGGTFDISILDIDNGVFEVRATNGDTHLGGEDLDILLMKRIFAAFKAQTEVEAETDSLAVQRVREAAEKAKIELLHGPETEINLPFLSQSHHFAMKLTESELDEMAADLIQKTIEPVKRCIRDAELKIKDVDEVLLVGGMTRMPKIRTVVAELFGKAPNTEVNPDEAVALGAAIQGAVLSGDIKNVVLLDVTPLSLGIETYGGIFSPLIPRNSPIPTKKELIFLTAVDGQTGVEISVFQGERPLVRDNKKIGHFKLLGIPMMLKGEPQVAVSFAIDVDGIINVTATDRTPKRQGEGEREDEGNDGGTPKSASITVEAQTGLTEEEVQQMIEESQKNKEQDAMIRQHMENATRADILCVDTENALAQFGPLMGEAEKKEIEGILNEVRSMIDDVRAGKLHSIAEINARLNELQKVCMVAIQGVAKRQKEAKEEGEKGT